MSKVQHDDKESTTALPIETPPHVTHEGQHGGSSVPIDFDQQKVIRDRDVPVPPDRPSDKPEIGPPPKEKPDMEIPDKPISDMNPPGQDEPDEG